jgi:CheY-like chemotaxis protein
VVLDQHLPGISGLAAVEALRARGVRTPAVLITTQPGPHLLARAKRAGALVVEKPILGDRLLQVLASLWGEAAAAVRNGA